MDRFCFSKICIIAKENRMSGKVPVEQYVQIEITMMLHSKR